MSLDFLHIYVNIRPSTKGSIVVHLPVVSDSQFCLTCVGTTEKAVASCFSNSIIRVHVCIRGHPKWAQMADIVEAHRSFPAKQDMSPDGILNKALCDSKRHAY